MKKVIVTFENILAGLLLRFGKASLIDIKVIQDDLFNRCGVLMSPTVLDYKGIHNFIMKMQDNYYPLEGSQEVLEDKQGEYMSSYFSNINIEDLILLKVNELGTVSEYQVSNVFCNEQEEVISKLIEDLRMVYVWNNDVPYDDYQELHLTFLGNARVFELQNNTEIEEFKQLLISEGYDASLVSEFLRVQDFSRGVYEILNLDNFLQFCYTYDRAAKVDVEVVVQKSKKD